MTAASFYPSQSAAKPWGVAAPWLVSLALHAALLAGLVFFYRSAVTPQAQHLEIITAPTARPAAAPAALATKLPKPPSAAPKPAAAQLPPAALAPTPTPPLTPAPATALAPTPQAPSEPAASASAPPASTKPSNANANAPSAALPTVKTAARFDAAYLQNPPPAYPVQSRRLNEAGTVQLLVKVTAQGTVETLSIHRSSGFARLDEAAKQAVQAWRFVPAKQGDAPAADIVIVPIVFKEAT